MEDVIIIYWTGTGNTEIMAEKIKEGLELKGINVKISEVYDVDFTEALTYNKLALGCPSMGIEELEEEEFEPFLANLEPFLANKKVAVFGSYGWGEGEWMEPFEERIINSGALLFEKGLMINSTPSEYDEEDCVQYGKRFAEF